MTFCRGHGFQFDWFRRSNAATGQSVEIFRFGLG